MKVPTFAIQLKQISKQETETILCLVKDDGKYDIVHPDTPLKSITHARHLTEALENYSKFTHELQASQLKRTKEIVKDTNKNIFMSDIFTNLEMVSDKNDDQTFSFALKDEFDDQADFVNRILTEVEEYIRLAGKRVEKKLKKQA